MNINKVKKVGVLLFSIFLSFVFMTACGGKTQAQEMINGAVVETAAMETPEASAENPVEMPPEDVILNARISVTGDLMVHEWQFKDAYDSETGTYDFSHNFTDMMPYFDKADLLIGNLETTFAGEDAGISGYPNFNTPDNFGQVLKDAGFDVLTTVNNHCMDKRQAGMERTIDVLDSLGIAHMGTYKTQEARDTILIKEVNGIKIALLSYTYGTNGMAIPEPYMVNLLDENLIKSDIAKAKELNPDFIIVMPHMGIEYETAPREEFKQWADLMLNAGADVVLASHPHVLQPMEYKTITNPDGTTRQGFVIYSLGNFISSQTTPPRNAGIVLNIEIEKKNDEKATIQQVSFIPTWTQFQNAQGVNHFMVRSVYHMVNLPDAELRSLVRAKDIQRLVDIHYETTKLLLDKDVPLEQIQDEYIFPKPDILADETVDTGLEEPNGQQ